MDFFTIIDVESRQEKLKYKQEKPEHLLFHPICQHPQVL